MRKSKRLHRNAGTNIFDRRWLRRLIANIKWIDGVKRAIIHIDLNALEPTFSR